MSILQDLKKYLPKVQDALSDLKEIDSYLNEINQAGSELSKADLNKIKTASFKADSDYGKAATDYLAAMREISRAGYENSEEIAKLSLALQNAGDMTAATKQSGSDVAKALKAILLNTRQVTDETEGITTTGLSRYEEACDALNVKLRETRNGVLSLRDPMEVLGELAAAYNRLGNTDARKQNLLESIGGKETAAQLDALLGQWETYERMLGEYKAGAGSLAEAGAKSASSWEGSANRLANAWAGFISSIAGSEAVIKTTDALSGLLGGLTAIAEKMEQLPALGTALGAFLSFKNVGVSK